MKDSIDRIEEEGYSVILKEFFERNQKQILMNSIIMENKSGVAIEMTTAGFNVMREDGVVYGVNGILIECSGRGMFIVDKDSREVLQVNGEDVSGIEHARVLDLNDDGERWEGDVLNDEPYGWGMLYDSENRMVYEGFRIGGVNVCYGRSYYPDNQKVEYEGEWCEGNRMGAGVLYDRNEVVIHDGEWVNNRPLLTRVEMTDKNPVLHNHIEELIVKNKSCNGKEWKSLDLSLLSKLRKLRIGDECFDKVERVKLNGLSELESVVVGDNSFTAQGEFDPFTFITYDAMPFEMKDCEKLKELIIGEESFGFFNVFSLENTPSMERIIMKRENFCAASCRFHGCGLMTN